MWKSVGGRGGRCRALKERYRDAEREQEGGVEGTREGGEREGMRDWEQEKTKGRGRTDEKKG